MPSAIVSHAAAFAILAAVTLPMMIALRHWGRTPLLPQRLFRPTTLEMLAFTLLAFTLPAVLAALLNTVPVPVDRSSLAAILAMPLWLAAVFVWLLQCGTDPFATFRSRRWAHDLASGIAGFLILTPITFAIYGLACAILIAFGGEPEPHPLTESDLSTSLGVAILLTTACVAAPIIEESIFRGLILPWARGRRWRPWLIFAGAAALLVSRRGFDHLGAMLFLFDLTTLMAFAAFGRELWKKWPSRTAASIFATAALFAVMHPPWPTPIPLTALGVGLGILTVRCGSVRPAIVAHALFNAVSAMVLLSGHAK
jgi:membrane protease YdiL (CAAX protease family)